MLILIAVTLQVLRSSQVQGDASGDFAALENEFYRWRMMERPFEATKRLIYKYNDKLFSYSLSQADSSKAKADELMTKLGKIPMKDLRQSQKMSYQILQDMLKTYIDGYKWRLYGFLNPLNLLNGPQRNPGAFVNANPFDTIGDYHNYLARLGKFPTQFDEIETLFRKAMSEKTTSNWVSLTRVVEKIDKITMENETTSVYYKPFVDKLDKLSVDGSAKASLRTRGQAAVKNVLNAYSKLNTFLKTVYKPQARKFYGVSQFKNGKDYYKACLKWYLSTDMTPEQVHEVGLKEVTRIEAKMKSIMKKQGFSGSIQAYFADLQKKPQFFKSNADEMLKEFKDMVFKRINPTLKKVFSELPELPLSVEPMPGDGTTGYYNRPAPDGSRPGVFFANVKRPKEIPTFTLMAVALHEANPGHHLQFSYTVTSNTPDFRRNIEYVPKYMAPYAIPTYTAYSEGWALYAEALGEDLGVYKDDYELMGRYSSEIFRACRLVVDTGIHYFGWDRNRSIDYFLNYTALPRGSLAAEVDRYISWPGQATTYKIGELKIVELRDMAKKKLGKNFDIKEFHVRVLENGMLPLSLLESHVKNWVDNYKVTPKPCTTGATSISAKYTLPFVVAVLTFMTFR